MSYLMSMKQKSTPIYVIRCINQRFVFKNSDILCLALIFKLLSIFFTLLGFRQWQSRAYRVVNLYTTEDFHFFGELELGPWPGPNC